MPCPCKDKRTADAPADSHEPGLACAACLEGHLGFAAVLAREVDEDRSRVVERRLCLGNLKAAEWHAVALGLADLAATVRDARLRFVGGDSAPVLSLLSATIQTPGDF